LRRCEIHCDGYLSGGEYLCKNVQKPDKGFGFHIEDEGAAFMLELGEMLRERTTSSGEVSLKDDGIAGKPRDRRRGCEGRRTRDSLDWDSCLMGGSHK
jgi:hypothetical protein